MSVNENQTKNYNNPRQFIQGPRIGGMQPMSAYQRAVLPQQSMQGQVPPHGHTVPHMAMAQNALHYGLIQAHPAQQAGQVFQPYGTVPSQQFNYPQSRVPLVYYPGQPNVPQAAQAMRYQDSVSHQMPQNVPINRLSMQQQPQISGHHVNASYAPTQPQPAPPKQERRRPTVIIRDPNQGGKDVTNEILNSKKSKADASSKVNSQPNPIAQEFIAHGRAAAKEAHKEHSLKAEKQATVKKDSEKQITKPDVTEKDAKQNEKPAVAKEDEKRKVVAEDKTAPSGQEKVGLEPSSLVQTTQNVTPIEAGVPSQALPVTEQGSTEKASLEPEASSKQNDDTKASENANESMKIETDIASDKEDKVQVTVENSAEKSDELDAPPTHKEVEKETEEVKQQEGATTSVPADSTEPLPVDENGTNEVDKDATADRDGEIKDNEEDTLETLKDGKDDADGAKTAPMQNGLEKPPSSNAMQAPKKKKRGKYKDRDTDMMSAFVDKPEEEADDVTPEEMDVAEQDQEDEPKEETWEDKDIKTEEAPAPQRICYDRNFLLEFSDTKEKPKGLPDIEPVLSEAHPPTKPLERGRLQSSGGGVDFMPNYMQKGSGGRQVGMSRSGKGGKTIPPKRIIPTNFEAKVELKRGENAWVRSSEVAKDIPDEEELFRKARGILNKLTPQKFEKLVDVMKSLEINTVEKLKGVIDLIFEKALLEPSFSKAYAQLCDVLSKEKMQIETGSNMTFKRLLLNKCQMEFEKEKTDEQQLEIEKDKHFENVEEEKKWQEELAQRRHKTKKRSLGNIRFIGELFKLKMLTESIMHTCVTKLLKDKDEESLECLCQLLTTIGKDLDHEKAKPRTDQYFAQIDKIITHKKVSSRIIFMLKDVKDLRSTKWVSRRISDAPKKIAEIHAEVKQEEMQMQLAHQQAAQKRMMNKTGGRDSPSMSRAMQNDDGWNQVPSKNSRSVTQVDPSRLKITKRTEFENISLGPGGRPGAWAQGASGGGSSRFLPGGEGESRQGNRFSALSAGEGGAHRQDGKGKSNPRGQQSRFGRSSANAQVGGRKQQYPHSGEQASVIEHVRRFVSTEGNRPTSPSLPQPKSVDDEGDEGIDTTGPEAIEDNDQPEIPESGYDDVKNGAEEEVSDEKIGNETKMTIEEYLINRDLPEAESCISNLNCSSKHHVLVAKALEVAIEKKLEDGVRIGQLLCAFVKSDLVSLESFKQGLADLLEFAEDIAVDIPHLWTNLGGILGPAVEGGTLPLSDLKTLIEPLIQCNKAGLLMAETLAAAVKLSSELDINLLWQRSGLQWEKLLREESDLQAFIAKQKMEFTTKEISSQKSLKDIIQDPSCTNESAIQWIQENTPAEEQNSLNFIRDLSKSIFHSGVTDAPTGFKFDASPIKKFATLLLKYVCSDQKKELEALYAAQLLAEEFKHPKDFLRNIFEALWDAEVISENSVTAWEKSNDELSGKGSALQSVKGFLDWLHENHDDDDKR